MRKIHLLASLLTASTIILTGCAQLQSFKKPLPPLETFAPLDLNAESQTVEYVAKIESFVVVLDASASMDEKYQGAVNKGYPKFNVAKDIISRMNNTIPDVELKSSLVTFGHGFFSPQKRTSVVYELMPHSKALLDNSLARTVAAQGSSPAGDGIEKTWSLLLTSGGQNAVIIVSDGEELANSPSEKIQDLKEMYGDRVCIYTIHVGNNPEGNEVLKGLVREARCGFPVTADEIASGENMADFVKKVFLAEVPKKQVAVDIDSDGDGVYDKDDECPDTPKGAIVDSRGCWVVKGVTFDYKKWDIKEKFNSNLGNIVEVLQKNPGLRVRIEGHTDNIASMDYNIKLSQKRAQAVKNYLVAKGIAESRITTAGFGFQRPIASNDTEAGRALNRRAEIVPVK
ncbi:MAG: OmpA family protein [Planctomycetota bacterium]